MDILHVSKDKPATKLDSLDKLPESGTIWLNFQQREGTGWAQVVKQLTGIGIHERHIGDAANEAHPSATDSTDDYELVVFRSLSPEEGEDQFYTRATAFFLFDRLLVTVSPANSRSVEFALNRMLSGKGRTPVRPTGIMHFILNNMVDRFMSLRETLGSQLSNYREELLDPDNPFEDWRALLNFQKKVFNLEMICDAQSDAVTMWKDSTDFEIDDQLSVRFMDLLNHIRRVSEFSENQQSEIDSLVQLHFSAVAHRTNEIVKVLTLISAIFLPLTLVAGIYGMNFKYMPELDFRYGYFFTLGGMLLLVIGLLIYFKIKKWI
ncbi:MAG: magnesium transporter CorA family protein [Acidiferrobacterales bacterium]|nr:magnesium transporter CorA family protein [Acidiferrobacterales bacterium]